MRKTAREIADDVRREIAAGVFPPGTQLRFADLESRYHVKRDTVKRAVGLLRYAGVVVDSPGRGVFVAGQLDPGDGAGAGHSAD